MDRDEVLATIDRGYAARMRADSAEIATMWAPNARFEVVGERGLIERFPGSPQGEAHSSLTSLIEMVRMTAIERVDAVVEGLKAAVLWRATVSFAGRPEFETMLYDFWELDEGGKIVSLVQFADTAKIASEMRALPV
jgi:ketosteroid isomerase-like protein